MARWLVLTAGLLLAGGIALGGVAGQAEAEDDRYDWCDLFEESAAGYPELEIIECTIVGPRGQHSLPRWFGLLSWGGRGTAVFDGYLRQGGAFRWPWPLDQPEVCWSLGEWLADQGLDYSPDCDNSLFEGSASLDPYAGGSAVLEFHLEGVLQGDGWDYYRARFSTTFALQEIAIWRIPGETLFTYIVPPTPADTGTGLAPPGFFIPEVAH